MRRYGASPLHLLAHLALLPLDAYALLGILDLQSAPRILLWLLAAVVLHDLVLMPAYSVLDRMAARPLGGAVNHVRIPAGLSLLMLLVFFGTIAGKGDAAFHNVSDLHYHGYLGRWLLVSAALFVISGVLYVVRARRRAG